MSSIFNDRQKAAKLARARHTRKFWRHADRDHYICPGCGRGGDEVERFEVHHVDGDPFNGDMDNLRALCRRCHYSEHDRDQPQSLSEWKQEFLALGEGEEEADST